MWHKIIATGYIGKAAELRYTPQGTPVSSFSLAVNSGYGKSKTTLWARVTIWGKFAESLSPFLLKGKLVLISGELQPDPQTGGPRIWMDTSGVAKASFEITAREIVLLSSKTETHDETESSNDFPF